MNFQRQHWRVLASVLGLLALLRLLYLLWAGEPSDNRTPRSYLFRTRIECRVEGLEGEQLRLNFPTIPLNLDGPFERNFQRDLELSLPEKPEQVRFQSLKNGIVVGQSGLLRLSDSEVNRWQPVTIEPLP